jgi:uncharacterized membrane protein
VTSPSDGVFAIAMTLLVLTLWHPVAVLALSMVLGPVAARRGTAADLLQHRPER